MNAGLLNFCYFFYIRFQQSTAKNEAQGGKKTPCWPSELQPLSRNLCCLGALYISIASHFVAIFIEVGSFYARKNPTFLT